MKTLRHSILLLATIVLSGGCTGDFEELNAPPGAIIVDEADDTQLGQAFAQSQFFGMKGSAEAFHLFQSLFGDLYAQYFANTQIDFDSDRNVQVGAWADNAWTEFYTATAPQVKFAEDFTALYDMQVEHALTNVWKVQIYHRMTDYWGPIIYSDFGNGQQSVAYDTQESIYRNFFALLDEAVAVLKTNAGGSAFAHHDQVYHGSVDQWLVYANSLRLRLAIRCKYIDIHLAKTEAEKAVEDGVMTSNSDNAMLITTVHSRNPYRTITDWDEFRMSATMESILKGYDDPRIGVYFSPVAGIDLDEDGIISQAERDPDGDGSLYEGLRNGHAKIDLVPGLNRTHSAMGLQFLSHSSTTGPPIRLMSAAETYFLRAEGALENWAMNGSARELYEEGIRASLRERTSASEAEINTYITTEATPIATNDAWETPASSDIPVAFEAGGDKERQLEQIITQKWLALYPDGVEAWAEVRRTGYPKMLSRLNSENPDVPADQTMRRLIFVDSEYITNEDAVLAAMQFPELAGRGGNTNSTRVWWDAKPE